MINMNDLKDKVVIITGSSLGIGKETAYKFAEEGCKVVITYYKDKKEGSDVLKKCLELGASDALLLQLNVMDDNSIKNCVKKVVDKFGRIDILVNNAGIGIWKPLKEQSFEDIQNQIRTNLEGLIKITKECVAYVENAIINIASGAGQEGFAELSVYCATKFGVRGFTQSIAKEIRNIKIYSVNPATTATRMTNFHGTRPEKVAQVIVDTAKGVYKVKSGSDIDVWEHV